MVDEKFAGDVLGVFYEKWFEEYAIGIPHRDLDKIVEGDRNEILKKFWKENKQSTKEKIQELMQKFGRTRGAITSRLNKRGLI